jgi:predicted N-acetyltransferase YhbS
MQIDYLANHSHFIPTLARWHYEEWHHLRSDDSIERRIERLTNACGRATIPTVFVAFDGTEPLGSAKLVHSDMDTRQDLGPWLAGVFVTPQHRRRGIGAALVRRAMHEANALATERLYLYTHTAEPFYSSLGWTFLERTQYLDSQVTLMSCQPSTLKPPM